MTEDSSSAARVARQPRSPLVWLLASVLVLAAVAGAAVVWLPGWIQSTVQAQGAQQLGRPVTVGGVEVSLHRLELELSDVVVGQPAGAPAAEPLLRVARLRAELSWQSLWHAAPVVQALEIIRPQLALARTAPGHYDVDDLIARWSAPSPQPGAPLPLFGLFNVVLQDGEVALADQPTGQTQRLQHVQLSLPFLSNLPGRQEVKVQPHLAFDWRGAHLDSAASSLPFAASRPTEVALKLSQWDVAPLLGYWPQGLPVRLLAGVVDTDLHLAFEQTPNPKLVLRGEVSVRDFKLRPAADQTGPGRPGLPVGLAWQRLTLPIESLQPLQRTLALGAVQLQAPVLAVRRSASGQIDWLASLEAGATPAAQPTAAATPAWAVSVQALDVQGGTLHWQDAAASHTQPNQVAQLRLDDWRLHLGALHWPLQEAVRLQSQAALGAALLSVQGQASGQTAHITAEVRKLPLQVGAPYLRDWLKPSLSGMADAQLALGWQARPGSVDQLSLSLPSLTLSQVVLGPPQRAESPRWQRLSVQGARMDWPVRQASAARIELVRPVLAVARNAQGGWMSDDGWVATPAAAPATTQPTTTTGPVWRWHLGELVVSDGQVGWADAVPLRPVQVQAGGLNVRLRGLGEPQTQPARLTLSTRLTALGVDGRPDPARSGRLDWNGMLGWAPWQAQGQLSLERLPLEALAPYLDEMLRVDVVRAQANLKAQLAVAQAPAGWQATFAGDAQLQDVQAMTLSQTETGVLRPARDLLTWQDLSVRGLSLAVKPAAPLQVQVQETALSDFYARLLLDERGHLNLQDVLRPAPQGPTSLPEGAIQNKATDAIETRTKGQKDAENSLPNAAAPVVQMGPISLVNGRVDFTDHFIQPNYSASLTELTGRMGGFASVAPGGQVQMADVDLRGRAQGTASLAITGRVNPLAQPLALDLKGRVRDLELPPLSPYAARYAGYGITRGKLDVDIAYRVDPSGQLSADHNIVLRQLQFGEADPHANQSLPVKLAVALLADRHGVIDLDLPVSGSLNDPQFRLAPIVFKVIGNLIVKAVTAPFSLLGKLFAGPDAAPGQVAFAPGTAALSAAAKAQLDQVAQSLRERPAVHLTISGQVALAAEREALKQAQLQDLVRAEQRSATGASTSTSPPAGPDAQTPPLQAQAGYADWLRTVYRRSDVPKPRNLLGLTKDLPVPEMQALLLSHLQPTNADAQALAEQRAAAVRDYLARHEVPLQRLFLGPARLVEPMDGWQPQAALELGAD